MKLKDFQYTLHKTVVQPFEIKAHLTPSVFFCSTESCSGSFETMTSEQQLFFMKLFDRGEETGKKL